MIIILQENGPCKENILWCYFMYVFLIILVIHVQDKKLGKKSFKSPYLESVIIDYDIYPYMLCVCVCTYAYILYSH